MVGAVFACVAIQVAQARKRQPPGSERLTSDVDCPCFMVRHETLIRGHGRWTWSSLFMITMCLSVNLSGRQELRIWEAGIISDSLIGLLERIFLEIHMSVYTVVVDAKRPA